MAATSLIASAPAPYTKMAQKNNPAVLDGSPAEKLEAALRHVLTEYDKLAGEHRALQKEVKSLRAKEAISAPPTV